MSTPLSHENRLSGSREKLSKSSAFLKRKIKILTRRSILTGNYRRRDPLQPKGVVDKNFEALDSFHGHIRTQHGRSPLNPSQIYWLDNILEILCSLVKNLLTNWMKKHDIVNQINGM